MPVPGELQTGCTGIFASWENFSKRCNGKACAFAYRIKRYLWKNRSGEKETFLNYAVMTVYRGLDGSANILSISGSVAN